MNVNVEGTVWYVVTMLGLNGSGGGGLVGVKGGGENGGGGGGDSIDDGLIIINDVSISTPSQFLIFV